ncbi:Sec63 Brl domain-containing protein [Pelagophyceae sp. CCMP2097]|nr:Sec63 Brl domain-containing protein [Pelagophyceae sp. CCMP2097]
MGSGDGARSLVERAFGKASAREWRDVADAYAELRARDAPSAPPTKAAASSAGASATAPRLENEWTDALYDDSAPRICDRSSSGSSRPAESGGGPAEAADAAEDEEEDDEDDAETEPAAHAAPASDFDAGWLVSTCEALGSAMGAGVVAAGLVDAARAHACDEAALQAALFELLGFEAAAFEVMAAVCSNAAAVAAIDRADVVAIADAMGGGAAVPRFAARPAAGRSGSCVTIATASELQASKKDKKLRFKQKRSLDTVRRQQDETAVLLAAYGADADYLAEQRLLGLRDDAPSAPSHAEKLLGGAEREYHGQTALGGGAAVEYYDGYQEVVVPPPRALPPAGPGELKVVRECLEPWAAGCFPASTKTLNRVQSAVFDVAYRSQKNLLVCAPTGAGKTNVALLCVLELVRRHYTPDLRALRETLAQHKAVYVAPLKALAQEVVEKLSERLRPLGLHVFELTGDAQLSQRDAARAHVLVVTPEKWDVVTRKQGGGGGAGDAGGSLASRCGLLIVDEIHLLAEERGAVLECVVARTRRLVESTQSSIRLVGLSATLPNYLDVAEFLGCSDDSCFFFGPEYRPVPLQQTFTGITETKRLRAAAKLDELAYFKALDNVDRGHQVMVFVHSRRDTAKTALALRDLAARHGRDGAFVSQELDALKPFQQQLDKCSYAELREAAASGFALHHAGMCRADRGLSERMFAAGAVRVLCCTATLAWGVNLPAHAVICKGTEIYDAQRGGHVDIGMLDVLQIFGRAGRPQFDDFGEATLLTSAKAMPDYLRKLARSAPIESCLEPRLADALNAEIAAGTVASVREGLEWLGHTFMAVRLRKNPLAYRVPVLGGETVSEAVRRHCELLLKNAAKALDAAHMVRFDRRSGTLAGTEIGRIASHYYLKHESIAEFNERLQQHASDAQVLLVVCSAHEFSHLKPRNDELAELDRLRDSPAACPISRRAGAGANNQRKQGAGLSSKVQQGGARKPDGQNAGKNAEGRGGVSHKDNVNESSNSAPFESELDGVADDPAGKAATLLQAHISRAPMMTFTLASDGAYVAKNAARVCRALFEMALRAHWPSLAERLLNLAKAVEKRVWWFHTPLRQIADLEGNANAARRNFPEDALKQLEANKVTIDRILDLGSVDGGFAEIGALVRNARCGATFYRAARMLPQLHIEAELQPITRTVLRCTLTIRPQYDYEPRVHGPAAAPEPFVLWVEDACAEKIHHVEMISVRPGSTAELKVAFTLAVEEPLPPQFYARAHSDRWVGCEALVEIETRGLRMPDDGAAAHTDLLPLEPLPVRALRSPAFEALYPYSHFNPVQTQVFWALYHSDTNVLVGAPTGSGKTLIAELAVLRMLNERAAAAADPGEKRAHKLKAVYVAPLKALARERIKDWRKKFGEKLGLNVVELTGDVTPDSRALRDADILITTPEKWDGVTRQWKQRDYTQAVGLILIDEIHLLGEDRGPVIEMIVTRARYVGADTGRPIRIVGLSTALANAHDLGHWLGVEKGKGLFNFRPSVRPVTMEAHVAGFAGKHYCPRMATMNKPCYQALLEHAAGRPALIFVASRRQTRLTALDLISIAASDASATKSVAEGLWLGPGYQQLEAQAEADRCHDAALRHSLPFGVGVHHAGLSTEDRDRVERLFEAGKILVLVCTATLAWGVNFPARLVIIKGTEFFDAKVGKYVDFPITDVLQMMGRAGRPQYDEKGVACIFVHAPKKAFYKKFLYEPFPVESHLKDQLHNHVMAEVCLTRAIKCREDAVDFLRRTYFYRRLLQNPSFYHLDLDEVRSGSGTLTKEDRVDDYLGELVDATFDDLEAARAISRPEDVVDGVRPEALGQIASYYYLDYKTTRDAAETVHLLDDAAREAFRLRGGGADGAPSAEACAIGMLCDAREFAELPVRHNEDKLNEDLAATLPGPRDALPDDSAFDDPHVKARLLLHARLRAGKLPIADYNTDTMTVLEQTSRVLAALVDVAADAGMLHATRALCELSQALGSACSATRDELCQLPGVTDDLAAELRKELRLRGAVGSLAAALFSAGGADAAPRGKGRGAGAGEASRGGKGRGDKGVDAAKGKGASARGKGADAGRGGGGKGQAPGDDAFRRAVRRVFGQSRDADDRQREARLLRFVDETCPRSRPRLDVKLVSRGAPPGPDDDVDVHISLSYKAPHQGRKQQGGGKRGASPGGWWFIIGDGDDLLALKRVRAPAGSVEATLSASFPANGANLVVYAVSDSIRGFDARATLHLGAATAGPD